MSTEVKKKQELAAGLDNLRKVAEQRTKEARGTLTAQQEQVIALLLAGMTQAAAAEEVGIAAETVTRWKSRDSVFIATYNATRLDLWEANHERLKSLRSHAVDVLAALLDSDHEATRLKAALSVLDLAAGQPTGPTEVEAVEKEWAEAVKTEKRAKKWDDLLDF